MREAARCKYGSARNSGTVLGLRMRKGLKSNTMNVRNRMAQLKQDEWPADGEPTTSEEEDGAFKREGPNPPHKGTGRPKDGGNRKAYESPISKVDPDQPVDEP